jgi:hypothetical protein
MDKGQGGARLHNDRALGMLRRDEEGFDSVKLKQL